MQIEDTSHLDGVSNGLLTKLYGRKCDWLTLRAIFPLLISLALVAKAAATPAYPLKPSANGRYVVDRNDVPFLIIGDAPHSILANLNSTDATTYLTNRGSNGFNALWIELLCDGYTGGRGSEGQSGYGRDINNNNPFTATLTGGYYDLTTPNTAYWTRVDAIIREAAANGLQCMLTPLDQGGWTQTSLSNGTTRCTTYGQFLGNRYKNFPNIIWNLGNDFTLWRTPENDAVILAIADGIRSTDTNHIITVQISGDLGTSQDDPNWISRINVNGIYTYYPTYAETLVGYNKPTVMPCLFLEAHYEYENVVGELGTPNVLRRQEYWSLTSGALAGHMYGNHYTWTFTSGWQSHLNTTGMVQPGPGSIPHASDGWLRHLHLRRQRKRQRLRDGSQDAGWHAGGSLHARQPYTNYRTEQFQRPRDRTLVRSDCEHVCGHSRRAVSERRNPQFHNSRQ
jgi:hypothetical protein